MQLASLLFPFASASTEREEGWFPVSLLGQRRTHSGESIGAESAMQLGPYYACLRNISEDLGKLPLILYRELPRGKERATTDPLYRLLHDAPNPEMTSMTFRETLTHWAMSWGNGYAEIQRSGAGAVIALHPIHPSRVRVHRVAGRVVYDIRSDPTITGGSFEIVRLDPADVFHVHGLGDGLMGYSVVRFAAESLGLTMAAQTFGAAFFGNGASVGGVLEYPGKLAEPARDNLRKSWQEMHGGAARNAKTAILEEGMKYARIGIPPDEAQFLETRQFQVVEVCRWFRMPPHKIQSMDRATFSNIESQNQEYVIDALMAWAVRFEQEIRRKLLPADGALVAEFLFTALLRGDQAARANYYRTQVNIGAMTPNEVRERENMNPLGAEADQLYMQSNMMPLAKVGTETSRAPAGPARAAPPAATDEDQVDDEDEVIDEDQERALDAQVAALRPVVADAANRILHREASAAAKAADRYRGNVAHFTRWADEFYADQARYFADAMRAPAAALASLAAHVRGAALVEVDVDAIARDHARASRSACVASLGASLDQANTVDQLTSAVIAAATAKEPAHAPA